MPELGTGCVDDLAILYQFAELTSELAGSSAAPLSFTLLYLSKSCIASQRIDLPAINNVVTPLLT